MNRLHIKFLLNNLDSNKLRHRLRRKLTADKKRLLQEIKKYNSLVADLSKRIDVALVDHSLAGQSTGAIWPWEDYGSGMHFSMLLKCHAVYRNSELF